MIHNTSEYRLCSLDTQPLHILSSTVIRLVQSPDTPGQTSFHPNPKHAHSPFLHRPAATSSPSTLLDIDHTNNDSTRSTWATSPPLDLSTFNASTLADGQQQATNLPLIPSKQVYMPPAHHQRQLQPPKKDRYQLHVDSCLIVMRACKTS